VKLVNTRWSKVWLKAQVNMTVAVIVSCGPTVEHVVLVNRSPTVGPQSNMN